MLVGKKGDVGEALLSEGLSNVQRHRDGDERSSNYDKVRACETFIFRTSARNVPPANFAPVSNVMNSPRFATRFARRSSQLCSEENAARAAKKNLHSTGAAPLRKVNDLMDPKKAKAYAGFLQRSGTLKATVEYVFAGSRYKLWVPKENCTIMFALNECRCPQPSPNNPSGRAAEPFGDDAKRFAKLNVGQRR